MKIKWTTKRPTKPGVYLIHRKDYQPKPELVDVRVFDQKLWYSGHISNFPLVKLEKNIRVSQRIEL